LLYWNLIREPLGTSALKERAVVVVGETHRREREKKRTSHRKDGKTYCRRCKHSLRQKKEGDILLGCSG
jgi:hypothetical protein